MKNIKYLLFLFLMQAFLGKAQQEIITSHQNKNFPEHNITLNGRVKSMTQITYDPQAPCDTILPKAEYNKQTVTQSGRLIILKCYSDSLIYLFDDSLSLISINKIRISIDKSYYISYNKNLYLFENGNLKSEKQYQDDRYESFKTFFYDSNNNLTVKRENSFSNLYIDSLYYDSNNNLVKKLRYREFFKFRKRGFKKKNGAYYLKKKNKSKLIKEVFDVEEFEYDDANNLISETISRISRKRIFLYDSLGNKIEEGYCKNYRGKECKYQPTEAYVYDENNNLIKKYLIGNWRPTKSESYYYYNENDQKIEEKLFEIKDLKDTTLTLHRFYDYDEFGDEIKVESIIGRLPYRGYHGLEKFSKVITTYDEKRNLIKKEFYAKDGKIGYIYQYNFTYDSYGNWIRKDFYEGVDYENLKLNKVKERIFEYHSF